MKKLSRQHKIALIELVLVLLIALYFFAPRSFSLAMGSGFDREQVTQIQVDLTNYSGDGQPGRTLRLDPADQGAQELLDRWDEAVAPVTGTLSEALMGGDFFSHDGLVGTADGAVWFGLTGDGQIRIFTLQTPEGAGVRPVSPGISAGPSPAPEA